MTRHTATVQVVAALDALNRLFWYRNLLELAIQEAAETYTNPKTDKLGVLLDTYRAHLDCYLEELEFALTTARTDLTTEDWTMR